MFDIGWGELLVIAVVGLVVLGPQEMIQILRALGKFIAKIKRWSDHWTALLEDHVQQAEIEDYEKKARALAAKFEPLKELQDFPVTILEEKKSRKKTGVSKKMKIKEE